MVGDNFSVYSEDLYYSLDVMRNSNIFNSILESDILNIWSKALTFKDFEKFWIHGDLTKDNILLNNKKLFAVIDFGCMAVGDRAVDLSIAYTFFEGDCRKKFLDLLNLDFGTITRGKAWTIWKFCFEIRNCLENDRNKEYINYCLKVIHSALYE